MGIGTIEVIRTGIGAIEVIRIDIGVFILVLLGKGIGRQTAARIHGQKA